MYLKIIGRPYLPIMQLTYMLHCVWTDQNSKVGEWRIARCVRLGTSRSRSGIEMIVPN